jgi:LuxR family maltose regulon positive regulatory protein
MVALPLAEAHYDRGDFSASLELLDTYLPQARVIGFADQLVAGCTARARIARLRGERVVALRVLEEAIQFARERSFEKLFQMLSAELVDVLCRFGETAEAARLAAKIGLRRAADSVMPRPRVTRARAALAYAWTSLAQAQGRCSEAIKVARKWRNLIEAAGAVRDALRWGVRLAVLLRHAGDEIGARRELHRAIGVAAPAGLMQVLLEETEALGESLGGELLAVEGVGGRIAAVGTGEAALESGLASSAMSGGTSTGVASGVGISGPKGARGSGSGGGGAGPVSALAGGLTPRMPGGSLTPREVEILTLVGEGLSNAEIGHRLSLVEGSVKWHLQRIYDKIGTRRRLVAVDRARRMGVFR